MHSVKYFCKKCNKFFWVPFSREGESPSTVACSECGTVCGKGRKVVPKKASPKKIIPKKVVPLVIASMRNYCIYFDHKYLAQFLALYHSMVTWCNPFRLWVMGLDTETVESIKKLNLSHVDVMHVSTIESELTRQLKEDRNHREYIWTLKPLWILYVLRKVKESVTYLDVDSLFFYRPDEVCKEIGGASIAITPHRFSASYEYRASDAGVFNAGFVYLRREAILCATKWSKQVLNVCKSSRHEGYFYDQKYLDAWPNEWDAHVVQHKGFNLAPWNQGEGHYIYSLRSRCVFVDGNRLIWYHFHQGMAPAYKVNPFLKNQIYEVYGSALDSAKQELEDIR